jgi:uncharacterized protein (TIRG00374 family)
MQLLKANWKRLLKLLGPLFFIFLILRVVDPKAAADAVRFIKLEFALISLLVFILVNAALALRWWVICQKLKMNVTYPKLFQIYYISWFLSLIPLAAITPVAKLAYLKDAGSPIGSAAVSITLDKLFDILGLLFFSLFAIVYFPGSLFKELHLWVFFAGLALLALILSAFGGRIWKTLTTVLKRYSSKRLQNIGHNLEVDLAKFWSDFDAPFLAILVTISIVVGLLRSLVLYLLALSLNIHVGFGLIIACRALFGMINIIPITFSGLGTREAILLPALSLSGVSKELALALGFVAFLWTLCSKFTGIVFWLKRPLPLNTLTAIKEKLTG